MAIPSGSGTEVLKRTTVNAQSNTATAFRWDGTMATTGTTSYTVPADHIITILSIIACEYNSTDEEMNLYMNDGSRDIFLIHAQTIPSKTTFVWNDKFILQGGDKLTVNLTSVGNMELVCSYIDQDWT